MATARRYVLVGVTRRQHRAGSWYPAPEGPENCHGARNSFAKATEFEGGPGTNFIEDYACRGTSFIGAVKLSPVTKLVAGTGAVSRYNLARSQKSVTVQEFNCGQMRALPTEAERRWVSGCLNHYKFILGAGANKNRDKPIKHTVRY